VRRGANQIPLPQHSDAHGVDQRISSVAGREAHLAAEGRDPDAVSIVAHSADHSGKEVAVAGRVI
jgi:hypothetical protein